MIKATSKNVIPAKAGIRKLLTLLDSRLRGSDTLIINRSSLKRIAFISFIGIIIILLTAELFAYYINLGGPMVSSSIGTSNLNERIRKNRALRKGIAGLSSNGVYIVIDTARNLLFLKEANRTVLEAVVSSGSGSILRDPSGKGNGSSIPHGESLRLRKRYQAPNG